MSTVKNALARKSGALIHVRSGDMVVEALRQMRDNRVRSVLVIDDDVLVGIVTQGDCAIKVLLPGLDAKQTPVGQVMTGNPVTVKPDDPLEGCMAMMAAARFSPSASAGRGQGRGRDLDRRRRQEHHPGFGAQRGRPDGLHHEGRPRGLKRNAGATGKHDDCAIPIVCPYALCAAFTTTTLSSFAVAASMAAASCEGGCRLK